MNQSHFTKLCNSMMKFKNSTIKDIQPYLLDLEILPINLWRKYSYGTFYFRWFQKPLLYSCSLDSVLKISRDIYPSIIPLIEINNDKEFEIVTKSNDYLLSEYNKIWEENFKFNSQIHSYHRLLYENCN